jgi:hypothetical protein
MGLISSWMLTTTGGWKASVTHRAALFLARRVLPLIASVLS